jgi:hypothetical protein
MLGGTKTLANISNQLHRCLEGEAIPVGDISELGIPLEYFFNGTIAHNSSEIAKNYRPHDTSFSIQGGLFPPPIGTKNVE